ncbi:hypothetical protein BSLG_002638 [Batrachochytrium salamandrivorans]|nr:hypothetical protein BSLG_002638 [Batrachochytrium salamandrivorans]
MIQYGMSLEPDFILIASPLPVDTLTIAPMHISINNDGANGMPDTVKLYPTRTDSDFPPLKNDLILRVVRGETVERVPVWIMRQAGRYLPEFRKAREHASKQGPHFPEPLVDPTHLARLVDTVDVNKELGYVFEAITLTRTRLDGRVPLFGFAGAPWTLMAYMIEGGGSKTLNKAKAWLYKYPAESHLLLQRTTDVIIEYLIGQAKAGAQQVVDGVKKGLSQLSPPLNVPISVFALGAYHAFEELSALQYDIVQVDWSMDPESVRQRVGGDVVLQGNADPSLLYGDRDAICDAVKLMLQKEVSTERNSRKRSREEQE